VTDLFYLFDYLVFCLGLVVIVWLAAHSSRRVPGITWPGSAVLGALAWLAALGVALYLLFG
jgi:hypothetical protein